MKPECPNYIAPKHYVDPATDNDYEGSAMCDLVDKACLVEHGKPEDCEEYMQFLKNETTRQNCPLAGGIECCEDCSECNK